jgi:hypothetical protein
VTNGIWNDDSRREQAEFSLRMDFIFDLLINMMYTMIDGGTLALEWTDIFSYLPYLCL